jgi:hypothetical protein
MLVIYNFCTLYSYKYSKGAETGEEEIVSVTQSDFF